MSEFIEGSGSCLCGATHFTAKNVSKNMGACHCSICRKWGGGPLMAVDCGKDVLFEGKENIFVFSSSEWAERGFCSHCGTHLFYRLLENKQFFMPVGLFDDDSAFIFDHQVFIEERPKFYCFANKTQEMTGAELFAHYDVPSSE